MTGHRSAPDRPRRSSAPLPAQQSLRSPHPQAGPHPADPTHDRLMIGIGFYDRHRSHQQRHRGVAPTHGNAP
jgi:hypothetical protein